MSGSKFVVAVAIALVVACGAAEDGDDAVRVRASAGVTDLTGVEGYELVDSERTSVGEVLWIRLVARNGDDRGEARMVRPTGEIEVFLESPDDVQALVAEEIVAAFSDDTSFRHMRYTLDG